MADPIGYVVIEWNQASGRPRLADDVLYDDADQAEEMAGQLRADTAAAGRRERFTIHPITENEEDDRG